MEHQPPAARYSRDAVHAARLDFLTRTQGLMGLGKVSLVPGDPVAYLECFPLQAAEDHELAHHAVDRLCDIAWMVVARVLVRCADGGGILDHHWMFNAARSPYEPFGFVTDTYFDASEIRETLTAAREIVEPWGVRFLVRGKKLSPHYPGNCTPIVVHASGDYARFIPAAVQYALLGESAQETTSRDRRTAS